MSLDNPSGCEMGNLTNLLSESVTVPDGPNRGKKVSKTRMLIAILGSIGIMILMELASTLYKNFSLPACECVPDHDT